MTLVHALQLHHPLDVALPSFLEQLGESRTPLVALAQVTERLRLAGA
jgi:hypothetical protein